MFLCIGCNTKYDEFCLCRTCAKFMKHKKKLKKVLKEKMKIIDINNYYFYLNSHYSKLIDNDKKNEMFNDLSHNTDKCNPNIPYVKIEFDSFIVEI